MIEVLLPQVVALLGLSAIAIIFIVTGYREYKYRKKIDFLIHLVDKGYEYEKIDINNL